MGRQTALSVFQLHSPEAIHTREKLHAPALLQCIMVSKKVQDNGFYLPLLRPCLVLTAVTEQDCSMLGEGNTCAAATDSNEVGQMEQIILSLHICVMSGIEINRELVPWLQTWLFEPSLAVLVPESEA